MNAAAGAADLALTSRRVVLADGVVPATIVVREGRIAAIAREGQRVEARETCDLGELVLMPGLVDPHVHVNEPGRTQWEGFATATRAAASGGVTTLVDMPLNAIPPTTTVSALREKRAAAEGQCAVDVAFWGGIVPGNLDQLEGLAAAGVAGFKCFLVESGVPEFARAGEIELAAAMPVLARLGLPLLAHAELPGSIADATHAARGLDPHRYRTYLATRPAASEVAAIRLLIRLCESTGCAVHIVHLSAAETLPDLIAARARGLPITVETCPHYLVFSAEEIPDGATEYKCAPPIRDRGHRERLWEALRSGTIDLVASDHSPCPSALKRRERGEFLPAWGGIASLGLGLSAMWSEAQSRGFTLTDLARWLCERPAKLAGLEARKGAIAVGRDADLVAFDPDTRWTVEARDLHFRHAVAPYLGRAVLGKVHATWLRGRPVYKNGVFASANAGALVDRAPASD
jgi:allantoinase